MADVTLSAVWGSYPAAAADWFDFATLDAFHSPAILPVLYGADWAGILVTDGNMAMLHACQPQPLPAGNGFDMDPFIGYAGPVLSAGATPEFREQALHAYRQWCREQRIVAEIIRFSPILRNDQAFTDSAQLGVFQAKELVVSECHTDEAAQLAAFTTKCRSSVKRGMRDCTAAVLDKAVYWEAFVAFYCASLDRIGADRRWYYSAGFFNRARQSDDFQVYGVLYEGQLASAALVIEHPLANYYFMAASSEVSVQGANEYLIFSICQQVAARGTRHLILGGGNTIHDDDPLLRFKRKFAHQLAPLMLGKLVHAPQEFEQLVAAAVARRPELAEIRYFLKYRL